MIITINRIESNNNVTIGRMTFDLFPLHVFYTLEDRDRSIEKYGFKVQDKTAIGIGEYIGVYENHPKFGFTFRLQNVKHFEGILCPHTGNFENDTRGCILIGKDKNGNTITQSKEAKKEFDNLMLMTHIKIGEKIKVIIKRSYHPPLSH